MQIAIISDTHNDMYALKKVIKEIHRRKVSYLVHCGDLTYRYMLEPCQGLRIYLAYGNGDLDQRGIAEELKTLNPKNSCGLTQEFLLDGQKFFVAHGDTPQLIRSALESGSYDWVLQGHTHRFKHELFGQTRWINPGALGGRQTEDSTFVILDTESRSIERILIKEA